MDIDDIGIDDLRSVTNASGDVFSIDHRKPIEGDTIDLTFLGPASEAVEIRSVRRAADGTEPPLGELLGTFFTDATGQFEESVTVPLPEDGRAGGAYVRLVASFAGTSLDVGLEMQWPLSGEDGVHQIFAVSGYGQRFAVSFPPYRTWLKAAAQVLHVLSGSAVSS